MDLRRFWVKEPLPFIQNRFQPKSATSILPRVLLLFNNSALTEKPPLKHFVLLLAAWFHERGIPQYWRSIKFSFRSLHLSGENALSGTTSVFCFFSPRKPRRQGLLHVQNNAAACNSSVLISTFVNVLIAFLFRPTCSLPHDFLPTATIGISTSTSTFLPPRSTSSSSNGTLTAWRSHSCRPLCTLH